MRTGQLRPQREPKMAELAADFKIVPLQVSLLSVKHFLYRQIKKVRLTFFFDYRFQQALVRGFLVRRKLLEVRKEFEDVLNDLEKDTNFVCWKTTTLGLPLISSDPKVLHNVNKEKISKENDDEVKEKDSLEDEFAVKHSEELETMLHVITGHGKQGNGERSVVDEEPVLERPASGASNSKSYDNHSDLLQINQESGQEDSSTFRHVLRPGEQAICSGERSSEQKRLSIPNSNATTQCDCPDEGCPRRLPDVPFPFNSTLKSVHGSGAERGEGQSVGRESTSETSLHSSLRGGTPHLRDQARLSDTWLTDRSFGKQLGRFSPEGRGGGTQTVDSVNPTAPLPLVQEKLR